MGQSTNTPGPDPSFTIPEKREKFLAAIRAGASISAALKAIGASMTSWKYWKAQAAMGTSLYVEFLGAVDEAEAELEQRLTQTWLDIIERAQITGDHRPLMEFMSRRFKENWSPTYKAEIDTTIEFANLDAEDVRRRLLHAPLSPGTGAEDSSSSGSSGPV
jgi:hypothetical protein